MYGLIFLFKWIEEDPDKLEQSCPEGVWVGFSNPCNDPLSRNKYQTKLNQPQLKLEIQDTQRTLTNGNANPAAIHSSQTRSVSALVEPAHIANLALDGIKLMCQCSTTQYCEQHSERQAWRASPAIQGLHG